jgi:MoxR-like ATPase
VRYPRLLSGLGGGWAMVPDAHWVSPVAAASLKRAHGSPLADLFWFHRALDAGDPTDSKAVAAAALAGLLLATALVERREYRTPERVRAAAEEVAATLSSGDDD